MASVRKARWTYRGEVHEAWCVEYTDQSGKRRRRTPKSGLKKDADELRRLIERELDAGTHTVRSETVTLAEACDLWLRDCERRWRIKDSMTGATLAKYRDSSKVILARVGGIKVSDLTSDKIQTLINELARHYAKSTLRSNLLRAVKLMLQHAVTARLLKRNPLVDKPVRLPRGVSKQAAIPSKEEIQTLLRASVVRRLKDHPHARRNRVLVVMLTIFGGLRAGEICGLQWADIDFERNGINVQHSLSKFDGLKGPKTPAGIRFLPMAPPLAEMLRGYRDMLGEAAVGYVITNRAGGPIQANWLNSSSSYWRVVCQEAGMINADGRPKYTIHRMRHVAVSLWLDGGLDAMHVKTMVGHARVSTTLDIYGHLFPENDQARLAVGRASSQFELPPPSEFAPSSKRGKTREIAQVIDIAV